MSLTFTQLVKELDLIKKRTGRYPEKVYLDKKEFQRYVEILHFPEIGMIMSIQRKKKILEEGKGIFFRGIPVERK